MKNRAELSDFSKKRNELITDVVVDINKIFIKYQLNDVEISGVLRHLLIEGENIIRKHTENRMDSHLRSQFNNKDPSVV